MRIIKILGVVSVVALSMGCASISDIENLQGQINSLKPEILALSSNAAFAKVTAGQAASKATGSALYLQDVYAKLTSPVCRRPISKTNKRK